MFYSTSYQTGKLYLNRLVHLMVFVIKMPRLHFILNLIHFYDYKMVLIFLMQQKDIYPDVLQQYCVCNFLHDGNSS